MYAAYLALNIPWQRFNVYAGVRLENRNMTLTNYISSNAWISKDTDFDNTDFFPSVNVSYNLTDKQLIRFAYGKSVNRQEFREVSSSVYEDFELFSDVKGNPDLKPAYIHNLDLRYEWYPASGESVSVALFYKHFRHPIEWTFRDGGGSYTYTFENADKARNYGVEVDIRKDLEFIGLRNFMLNLNGSWIKSKVSFDSENSLEHDRPMQGQSPYLVNAGLFYQTEKAGVMAGVLYNRIGKRIVGIGRSDMSVGGSINNDIPDMYEMPHDALDIVLSKKFGKQVEVNTYYRFYDIFCEMFPPDEAEFPSLRESLTNLCLHMLAQNDIRMGMTREDYHKRLLAKEILDGNFGEIAGNVFRSMSSKEQEILLGGWLNSFRTGSVLPVFLDMVHGLVADSIVYHNNAYPDEILIYTGWKRERNLEQRIRFLIDTFLDIRYRVEIFYEYHFGIIGVEETMRIGEIAIC